MHCYVSIVMMVRRRWILLFILFLLCYRVCVQAPHKFAPGPANMHPGNAWNHWRNCRKWREKCEIKKLWGLPPFRWRHSRTDEDPWLQFAQLTILNIDLFSSSHSEVTPSNAELNPICHLLALLGAHHIFHVNGLRVKVKGKTFSTDFFFLPK